MPTATTLNVELKNTTSSGHVFAYITGRSGGALFLLRSDGSWFFPPSPPVIQSPLGADCGVRLARNASRIVTVPRLDSARIWFSVDTPLTFKLNKGPALVEPSVTNPSDPNVNILWGFSEFSFNDFQVFANISYVDFVSLPISLNLISNNPGTPVQHVTGIAANGLDTICQGLRDQDARFNAGWSKLIVQKNGRNLRALSPNLGIVTNPSLFQNYWTNYVNRVWAFYSSGGHTLEINTQSASGTVTGRVLGDGLFHIGSQTFSKPSARDIFSCSAPGPFDEQNSPERRAIIPRLAAALNRSTLLVDTTIPDTPEALFYKDFTTNHYSRIVHENNLDKRGYAFPYDDVAPAGGKDESGSVSDGNPRLLTLCVGGSGSAQPHPQPPQKPIHPPPAQAKL